MATDPALSLRNLISEYWNQTAILSPEIDSSAMNFDTEKMNKDFKYPSIYVSHASRNYTLIGFEDGATRRDYVADGFLFVNLRCRPKATAQSSLGTWKGYLWSMEEELVRIMRRHPKDATDIAFWWDGRFVNRNELDESPAILRSEATMRYRFYKVD